MEQTITSLTVGGLQRKLRAGNAGDTMHLWVRSGDGPKAEEFLAEIELVRVDGKTVTLRIWAPDQVSIVSAKKDPHSSAA